MGELDAYMDLVWCEGAMELSVGSVDHFDHVSLANTLHLMEIELNISLFRTDISLFRTDISLFSIGHAGLGASGGLGGHDDYCSGNEASATV